MRTLGKVTAVVLCVALAVSLGGCFKHRAKKVGGKVSADTSVVGTINIYTSLPQDQADKYLAQFHKEYPNVKTNVTTGKPFELADKLVKEKAAPVADVVWHTPLSAIYRDVKASVLTTYTYHPGQLDAVQSDWTDPDNPDEPVVTGTDGRVIAFGVNTSKTGGSTPQTFSDLTDSKYSGQIVMPSINTEAGYALVSSLLSNMGDDVKPDGDGWTFLTNLDKNVAYYTDNDAAAAQAVGDGNAGLAIDFDSDLAKVSKNGSVQLAWPGLPEMSPFDIDVDALVKKPSPSNAAKTFLDWAISDNAMLLYAQDTPITSVDEGNGYPEGYPSSVSDQLMQNPDFDYMQDNHDKIVAEWTKRFGSKVKSQ